MEKQNSQKQNKPAAKREKVCVFDKDLACSDCRLYIEIPGFKGEFECAFIISAIK